mgnify:CR=1 FL=1
MRSNIEISARSLFEDTAGSASQPGVSGDTIRLCIRVRDTGIGIRNEDIPYIFGNFQRLDEGHNHSIEGTGLGLSIVKRMTELMNGQIDVQSEYGRGSVFTVVLPQIIDREYAEDASKTQSLDAPDEKAVFTTPECTYLVVDDNRLNLIVAGRFLDELQGKVETASGGREALQRMQKKKYDLIFMDHMMPEMDGIETFREAVKDPENRNHDTPVIMMTANALDGVREEYLEIGFADYLSKPLDINELKRAVRKNIKMRDIDNAGKMR